MQNFIIFLYILFFSIISTVVWICLAKKKEDCVWNHRRQSVRELFFFFLCNFLLLSVAKTFLYSADSTLFDSFWDIEIRTYINYGIPLFIFSIIVPITIRFLFKERAVRLINCIVALMFLTLIFIFIFKGSISNGKYCITFVVCVCIALIYSIFQKTGMEYVEQKEWKKYVFGLIPVILAGVVMIVLYLPNELYLSNYCQFTGSYGMFFLITFLGSILCGGIALFTGIIGTILLPKRWFAIFSLSLMGIICMGYFQVMFLNGKLKILDGVQQNWSGEIQIANMAIWFIAVIVFVILAYKKELVQKIGRAVCLYITAIQIVTLGVLAATTDYSSTLSKEAMTTQGSLELSQGNNVLVFVLDCYEASWFEAGAKEEPAIIEALADFTYYKNGTSQFVHTDNAIPYMLTGVSYNENISGNYAEYAYKNSDVLSKIVGQGYDIGIYTNASYLADSAKNLTTNYRSNVLRRYSPIKTIQLMIKTSMYKMVPFTLKQQYRYYSGDVFNLAESTQVWNIDNDLPFYNSLLHKGVRINDELSNSFRFFHMRGPHAPCYLSEEIKYEPTGKEVTPTQQGRGSLKIVFEYIEQMKKLGVYDEATIIITADHGQGNLLDSDKTSGNPDRTSRPIFIVKKPNEKRDTMRVSNAPVSQAELLPTILKAVGVDGEKYGRTFEEISEKEQRKRTLVDIFAYYSVQYSINGDAKDINSWNIEKAVYEK